VWHNPAYGALPVSFAQAGGYYASPPGESVDGQQYPWGWQQGDYDDDHWPRAQPNQGRSDRTTRLRATHLHGEAGAWQLAPRTIPFMEERPVRFASVRRSEGVDTDGAFLQGAGELVVPARTRAVLLLDQAHLTNAYRSMVTSGGAGSKISATYAEALKDAEGIKGHRNEIEGKSISGLVDVFYVDGGEHRRQGSPRLRRHGGKLAAVRSRRRELRCLAASACAR